MIDEIWIVADMTCFLPGVPAELGIAKFSFEKGILDSLEQVIFLILFAPYSKKNFYRNLLQIHWMVCFTMPN